MIVHFHPGKAETTFHPFRYKTDFFAIGEFDSQPSNRWVCFPRLATMPKELERDLGLYAVIAISMGAMIGSGIFILPGLAMAEAGPAVIVAFVVAGVLVIPAALSIAELGTAMPEAGGDYVFIERGMGPGAGTIAGLGTWLMLMFKGALALVGGMFYLELVLWLPSVTAAAVILATILIAINMIGVKQTGRLQTLMVVVMVIILAGFVVVTITRVENQHYQPFFAEGTMGVLGATTMVLVSYAGVTKVAAVAEEIENPGRNLPLGLLLSLVATTFLYALIVFVLVGIIDGEELAGTNVPMAIAIEPLLGYVGVVLIVLAAMLALVSTANAGILTASRYPLALARDDLIPGAFEYIHARFSTPLTAIAVTGGAMIAIVVFLPVEEIAKTAGAFQILVYVLVNLALIAFRERGLEWYDPEFESPAYPWIQLFGVVSGVFIIAQMDTLPLVGAVGIVVLGSIWYVGYGRKEVEREGGAVDLVRRETGRRFIEGTRETMEEQAGYDVLIAIRHDVSREEEDALLRIAAPIARPRRGRINVVRFDEVPDQVPLDAAAKTQSPADIAFEERTDELTRDLEVTVEVGEVVSHDTKRAVVGYADRMGVDLVLGRQHAISRLETLLGRDTDWILDHAPCDVAFVQNEHQLRDTDEIAVVTDQSPFNDPLKVELANAIAKDADASIRFLFAVPHSAPDTVVETIEEYHAELDALCSVPITSSIIRTDDAVATLAEELAEADLIVLTTRTHRRIPDLLFAQDSDRIAAALDRPLLLVHSQRSRRATFLEPIVDRLLFRSANE